MLQLLIVLTCILLNAILAAIEMAFVSVPRARLRELARSGNRDAEKIVLLRKRPERTLSVVQIGITLVGVLGAAVGGAGAEEVLSPYFENALGVKESIAEAMSILLVVIPLTYMNVVVGELVPKSFALKNPLRVVLWSARALFLLDQVLSPMVSVLEWTTAMLLKFLTLNLNPEKAKSSSAKTSAATIDLNELSHQNRQYILNLVGFERKKVQDIMLPWAEVAKVPASQSAKDVENAVVATGHTRLPIIEDGEVKGLLNTKEFTALRASGVDNWQQILRQPVVISAESSLLKALYALQQHRSHLAIVGSLSDPQGIITLEDIIEEVVGDIFDEDDDGKLKRLLADRSGRASRSWT